MNGKLLQDALVEVYKLERLKFGREWDYPTERVAACMTGENGKFCFDNLPPGLYEVRFSKEDYKTLSYEGINIRAKGKKKNKEACLHPVLWGS